MQAIQLPPRCDRASTNLVYPELIEMQNDDAIKIDASKVEQIGQAMLQLLASTAKAGEGVEVTEASDAFREAVQLAKLEDLLNLEDAA